VLEAGPIVVSKANTKMLNLHKKWIKDGASPILKKVIRMESLKKWKLKTAVELSKKLTIKSFGNTVVNQFDFMRQSKTLHSKPVNVDIVVTKECNLKCIFCKDYPTSGAKYLSVDDFEKAASQLLPSALNLSICSGGEPYMNRQILDILRIAKRYSVRTVVLSNATLLKEELIRKIIREDLIQQHNFSVDGINAVTVEAIRLNARLDIILKNIEMVARIREEEGKKRQKIGIRYALMRSNINELPDAIRYWGELGIDELVCNYVSLCNNIDHQESLYFHQEVTEQIFNEAKKVASNYPNLFLLLPHSIQLEQEKQKEHSPVKCDAPWRFVYIDTDGQIMPCYRSLGLVKMGNLYDEEDNQPFKKLWNSIQYRELRSSVNNDNLDKFLPYCSVCEARFGMGSKESHLGDERWFQYIGDPSEKSKLLAHRSRSRVL
jgi:radical SAM protein with 4Fe4S-binding SPASM domain